MGIGFAVSWIIAAAHDFALFFAISRVTFCTVDIIVGDASRDFNIVRSEGSLNRANRLRPFSIRRPLRSTRQPRHQRPSAVACRGADSGPRGPPHGHGPLRSKWDDRRPTADVFRRVLPRTAQRDSTTGSGCRVENPAETGGCRSWECMSSSLRGDTACPVSSIRVFSQPGHFLSSAEFASRPSGKVLSSGRFCRPWSPGCTADSHCRSAAGFSRRSISARHAAPRRRDYPC